MINDFLVRITKKGIKLIEYKKHLFRIGVQDTILSFGFFFLVIFVIDEVVFAGLLLYVIGVFFFISGVMEILLSTEWNEEDLK